MPIHFLELKINQLLLLRVLQRKQHLITVYQIRCFFLEVVYNLKEWSYLGLLFFSLLTILSLHLIRARLVQTGVFGVLRAHQNVLQLIRLVI